MVTAMDAMCAAPVVGLRVVLLAAVAATYKSPNLVFILGDDIGWSDMGSFGYDLTGATPTMDQLASEGVKLYAVYGGTACSPGRAAFLSGRYPMRFGMQNGAINTYTRKGIFVNESLISDELKKAGYYTAMVGKWHVGHAAWCQTPTYRGFDTYLGFMCSGDMSYSTKMNGNYIDLYIDDQRLTDEDALSEDVRSSWVFDAKVTNFIENHRATHGDTAPFFLYIALQDPHTPLTAPDYFLESEPCSQQSDEDRQVYCGMIRCIDATVENVMVALSDYGYYSNTIVMFSGDNGGAPKNGGYNWPLRGSKGTLYEGGIRQLTFIWGTMLAESVRGTTYDGPIHLVDMLPTFLSVATGGHWQPGDGKSLDGYDMWDAISTGATSPRISEDKPTLLNAVGDSGGLRWGNWSLLYNCKEDGWYEPPAINGNSAARYIAAPEVSASGGGGGGGNGGGGGTYLFELGSDPTQQTDVASDNEDVVEKMMGLLNTYIAEQVDYSLDNDKESDAATVAAETGYWGPWLDGCYVSGGNNGAADFSSVNKGSIANQD